MRKPDCDPQKVLRTALKAAGIVNNWKHSCRRCKKRGKPQVEICKDADLKTCPVCGMRMWITPIPRRMRFHDVRHSAATRLLRKGVDLHRVQRFLRHADPRTTATIYGHLIAEDLRGAAELLGPAPTKPTKDT
jgi:integrase